MIPGKGDNLGRYVGIKDYVILSFGVFSVAGCIGICGISTTGVGFGGWCVLYADVLSGAGG